MGSHCWQCIRAAAPSRQERVRMWQARAGPIVTKALIAMNLTVFVLATFAGGGLGGRAELERDLALNGPAVASGDIYRLVTSGFVHYGLLHLGFNMVVLFQFGTMLEGAMGRVRFAALYLAALLAGAFGALLLDPRALTGGASGAVYGLFGAAAAGLRLRGANIWQSGLGPLLAINLVFTFAVPGISIGGHLGGLAGGAIAGWAMLDPRLGPRGRWWGLGVTLVLAAAAAFGCLALADASVR